MHSFPITQTMNTTIAPLTPTTIAEISAALDEKRSQRQDRPAPIQPLSHEELRAKAATLQIPILGFFNLGPDFVGKLLVKFNIGHDPRNTPEGVREFKHTMGSAARMAANLKKAVEVAGEGIDDKGRIPGRTYDTALGILGAKKVQRIRVAAMPELAKTGLTLRDVNVQRSGSGAFIVVFVYTRNPFADGKHFLHCEEPLARQLEARFSRGVSRETTSFYNPDKSVTVNVGPYWDGPAEKEIVIAKDGDNTVLKIEEVTK